MDFKCPKCKNRMRRLYYLKYLGYNNPKGYPTTNTSTDYYICQNCDKIRHVKVEIK